MSAPQPPSYKVGALALLVAPFPSEHSSRVTARHVVITKVTRRFVVVRDYGVSVTLSLTDHSGLLALAPRDGIARAKDGTWLRAVDSSPWSTPWVCAVTSPAGY